MITDKEKQATLLSPTKKDYFQIWNELLELASKISERWSPDSTNEADPGIVLLKVLTGIADKINYTVDKNILEAYMPSAAQEESMRKLCSMMGYNMKYYQSATTDVTIYYNASSDSWEHENKTTDNITTALILPKYTQVKNSDEDIIYSTLETATFTKYNSSVKIPCIEGTVSLCGEDNDGIVTADNIDDDYKYYLPVSQVAENGIFIYNVGNSTTAWTQVDNLNAQPLQSKVYKFGYDSKEMLPYVQFPTDVSTLIRDGLYIYYVATSGASGNISAKTLSQFDAPSEWTVSDENTDTDYNTTGYTHTSSEFVCYNGSAASNGANRESLENAYINFKKTVGTFDTLVTCRDYMNKIYQLTISQTNTNPLVSNIIVSDIKDDINSAITICSFNGYGISYDSSALINSEPKYDVEVTTWPDPSAALYNKVYRKATDTGYDYRKCVKLTDGTYVWGYIEPDTEDTKLVTNFDLVLYPFRTVYGLNTKDEFDSSFKYDDELSTLDTIQEKLEDYKTLSHNFKTPIDISEITGEPEIACIKNYLKLNAKITTTSKVSTVEWSTILENIKSALFENFNCRNLDFSEEIPFDSILSVIEQADVRIKNVSLDDPDLYTAILLSDNTEYFIQSDEEAEENIKTKLTASEKTEYNNYTASEKAEFISAKIQKAKELSNALALRNILAGRLSIFNYDTEFGSNVTESKNSNYNLIYKHTTKINESGEVEDVTPAIKFVTTNLIVDTIESTDTSVNAIAENDSNGDATTFDATLAANEVVQFRAPNFRTKITYPAYVNYYLKLKDDTASYGIPATFGTIKSYLNEDKSKFPDVSTKLAGGRFTQLLNSTVGDARSSQDNLVNISTQTAFNSYKNKYGGAFERVGYKHVESLPSSITTDYRVYYNNIFYEITDICRYKKDSTTGAFVQDNSGAYLKIYNFDGYNNAIYVEIISALYVKTTTNIEYYDYTFKTEWPAEETPVASGTFTSVAQTMTGSTGTFTPRTTEPLTTDTYAKCYDCDSHGGWSGAIEGSPMQTGLTTLNNCVGYAQGRFCEIYYQMNNIQPANIKQNIFWGLNCHPNNFLARVKEMYPDLEIGQTPKVGAILVLRNNDATGHVAVVEKIEDGVVILSESEYGGKKFKLVSGTADNLYGYGAWAGYTLDGFIYNPAVSGSGLPTNHYTVTINVNNGTGTGVTEVYEGFSTSLTITPNDGYYLAPSGVVCSTNNWKIIDNRIVLYNVKSAITLTVTCKKNPDLYMYPLIENTYSSYFNFITSCKDYSTKLSGLYKNMGTDASRSIGKLVDINKNKFALANYWDGPSDAMTYYYVQLASESTTATQVNENTNATVWGHTLDGLGADAVYNTLKANAEYQLTEGEYLCINYTNSEATGTTDTGSIATTTTVKNEYYGPGEIIKTNFDAKSSAKKKLEGTSYAKTSGFDFTKWLGTGLGELGIPGMYSLGVNDQIEIREQVKTYIYDELNTETENTNPVYVYFKLNNEHADANNKIKFLSAKGQVGDSYTLQEGEYFWYTDRNKQTLNYCGDGCKVSNFTAWAISKSASSNQISIEDIFEEGIDIIPWITITGLMIKDIDNPGGYTSDNYIEWDEYQYINLGENDTLNSITFTDTGVKYIDSNWQDCTAATYTQNSELVELPQITCSDVEGWKVHTKLTLAMNPEQSQTLITTSNANSEGIKKDIVCAYSSDPRSVGGASLVDIEAANRYDKDAYGNYTQNNDGDYWEYPTGGGVYYNIAKDYINNRYAKQDEESADDIYVPNVEGLKWNKNLIVSFNNISLKSNYIVSAATQTIQTSYFDENTNAEVDDFAFKAFDSKSIVINVSESQAEKVMLNTVNGIYSKLDFSKTVSKPSVYSTLYCALPTATTVSSSYGLLMIYYSADTETATTVRDYVSIRLKKPDNTYIAPKIFNYPNSTSESWWTGNSQIFDSITYYCLQPGINIIKLEDSCNIEIYSGTSTKDTIVFDQLKIVNQSIENSAVVDYGINLALINYFNNTETNNTIAQTDSDKAKQLLKDINIIDPDHQFYYSLTLDESLALNINSDAKETLLTPAVFYEYNNMNNKFVISEIDSDYLGTGIVLARSSSK